MNEFLIFDFEALSLVAWECKVLSFSAITGNWEDVAEDITQFNKLKKLNVVFDLKSQFNRQSNEKTIGFWKSQPKEIRQQFKVDNYVTLKEFVNIFDQFCHENIDHKTHILARGLDYDPVILKSIYYDCGREEIPYNYRKLRDVRTSLDDVIGDEYIQGFGDYALKKFGWKTHISMDDCKKDLMQMYMVKYMTVDEIYKIIRD